MDERISGLLAVIKEEDSLYRNLIEHAKEKTVLLAQVRVEAIQESNKVEETLNIKMRFLENEMKRLCSEICQIAGIAREEFTLEILAEKLEQPASMELKSQTDLLRNSVMELKAVSQRNLQLVEASIQYSQGLLGLISNATSPYQRTGLFRSIPAVKPTFSHRA